MNQKSILPLIAIVAVLLIPIAAVNIHAENVPSWVKNTALWYGEGTISEGEFLNAIKFLIDNEIIVISSDSQIDEIMEPVSKTLNVVIPNGNANVERTGFYIPLNAQIKVGSTVVWVNDDVVPHTVQSLDDRGNIIGLFNSAPLETGDRFAFTFDEPGVYNYFCTLHPWRVGVVTVTS